MTCARSPVHGEEGPKWEDSRGLMGSTMPGIMETTSFQPATTSSLCQVSRGTYHMAPACPTYRRHNFSTLRHHDAGGRVLPAVTFSTTRAKAMHLK